MLFTAGHSLKKAKVGSIDSMALGMGSLSRTKLRRLAAGSPNNCSAGYVLELGHSSLLQLLSSITRDLNEGISGCTLYTHAQTADLILTVAYMMFGYRN